MVYSHYTVDEFLPSTCKNSGTFEEKKISPEKVTYISIAPSHSISKSYYKLQ